MLDDEANDIDAPEALLEEYGTLDWAEVHGLLDESD